MPESAAAPDVPDSLRLVLFGPAGAGKSSLLGALPQAAEAQPHLLDGRIADPSPNLLDLRRRVYDQSPSAGEEEVVPYSFKYEPGGTSGRVGAVVLDCNGRAADALIRDPAPAAGPLGREALHADALVLAVDASAPPERLDAEFAEFDHFLRRVEEERGTRTEVGGLPVFLVLTKCDLLARPGETAADWLEHIEERKREIAARFHDFLAGRDAPNQPPAFGRIRLHLWATAVRRPALAGAAARPTDPYGVAELFRQCLDQAAGFRSRRERSAHRLVQMTLAAAGSLLVLLSTAASLVVADALRRPPSELEVRVEHLRRNDPNTPEARLRGSPEQLQSVLEDWRAMRQSADFAGLPPDLQAYVQERWSELEDYVPWREKLEEAPRPREALTEEDLRSLRASLDGPLAPPRPGWDDTDAGRVRRDRIAESDAMLAAIADLQRWYQGAGAAGDDLWLSAPKPTWNDWAERVRKQLDATGEPPDADPMKPLGDAPSLTYADVKDFRPVAEARARWDDVRGRLRRLRDLAAALGLIDGVKDKPDLLVVPSDMSPEQAAERYRQLQKDPDSKAALAGPPALPPAAAGEVQRRVKTVHDLLRRKARDLILGKLQEAPSGDPTAPDKETRERWRPVQEWLRDPKELAGRRELAWALARLDDPAAPDPVSDLASFLEKDSFPIHISEITVVLPEALEPELAEPLKVYSGRGDGTTQQVLVFKPVGSGSQVRDGRSYAYRFTAEEPIRNLDYVPGDVLYADLPLAGRKTLRWDKHRSRVYQFEALREAPVLLDADRPGVRSEAKDVELHFQPDDGVPRVPDFVPSVELK